MVAMSLSDAPCRPASEEECIRALQQTADEISAPESVRSRAIALFKGNYPTLKGVRASWV